MKKTELKNYKKEMDKIKELILPGDAIKTAKEAPKNFKDNIDLKLHELNTYDKVMKIVSKYQYCKNYDIIASYVAQRVYFYLASHFLELCASEFDYVELNPKKIAKTDIKMFNRTFDIKLTKIIHFKSGNVSEEEMRNINSPENFRKREDIARDLIIHAKYKDLKEGKLFFIIFSKTKSYSNTFDVRGDLYRLQEVVKQYFSNKYKLQDLIFNVEVENTIVKNIVIPIIVD